MGVFAENGGPSPESPYDRFPWLYAFCRDHLFRDDTEKISAALWPAGIPPGGANLVELGCGPGFYARRLAGRFNHLRVTGIDRSSHQLRRARSLAKSGRLDNCVFAEGDVLDLALPSGSVDSVVASRLFIILSERERALSEIHRVLRPGGRCFIAEPRSALRACVPLRAMRLLAGMSDLYAGRPPEHRDYGWVSVLSAGGFRDLVESQPWHKTRRWRDVWYQYAVCEKAGSPYDLR